MRDTPFVEWAKQGGWSGREAATVERWLEDHRPAGKGPIHFVAAFKAMAAEQNKALIDDKGRLLERIDNLEEAMGVFGVKCPMSQGR